MSILGDLGMAGYIPDFTSPRYTQEYFPVESIEEGLIITKDKRYLKIVEVKPVNFMMKTLMERDDIISDFERYLLVSPNNIQLKIVASNSDSTEIIDNYVNRMHKDKDYDVETYVKHEVEHLNRLGRMGAISIRFYAIISYEEKPNHRKLETIKEIAAELNNEVRTMASYMSKCGNLILPISRTGSPEKESWAVGDLLYQMFNPRTSSKYGTYNPVTFKERCERIYKDIRKINETHDVSPDMASLLAPTGIDTHESDCIIMDGKYYSTLLVEGSGYPLQTYGGWFNLLINELKPGDSIDIFLHKENSNKVLKKVSGKIRDNIVKRSESNEMRLDYEKIGKTLASVRYIKSAINDRDEKPFYFSTLITLSNLKYNDLLEKREDLIDKMEGHNIKLFPCNNMQEEAFRCTFPFLSITPKVYEKSKRNIMSSGLSSIYPFCSYEKNDKDGFLLGLNLYNGSLCIINPWERPTYNNSNMVILGTSGAGKTFILMTMALRIRASGIPCYILAPDKAHEFKRACDAVNGSFIKISGSSNHHINVMDIIPFNSESQMLITGEEQKNVIYVSEKAQDIITFVGLVVPDLSNEEQQIIDTSVIQTYAKYGITDDNNSIYKRDGSLKEMPILSDLYEQISKNNKNDKMDRVLNILSQFITGSMKSFNARTNVNLDNKYTVFDISALSKNMIPAGMFIALNYITNKVHEDVTEKDMVFIDEAWQLIGGTSNPKAAEYVQQLFKTIRAYGGGVCVATQDVKDFFALDGGKYGSAIISNSDLKILLKLSDTEVKLIQDIANLTRQERKSIQKYEQGECLIIANNNHIPAKAYVSAYNEKLITTNPELVKKVIAEMKANGGKLL